MNDYRNAGIALGMADLSAAWPMYLREGNSANALTWGSGSPTPACTYQCSTVKLGAPASIASRTSLYSAQSDGLPIGGSGGATAVGAHAANIWTADVAHLGNGWTVPYLLTGDYAYLEESYFWVAYCDAYPTPNGGNYGRPIAGNVVTFYSGANTRQTGWPFRYVADVWGIAPDNTPEKSWVETSLNQMLATAEGMHGITGTPYQSTTAWNWGNTVASVWPSGGGANNWPEPLVGTGNNVSTTSSPLHEWEPGNYGAVTTAMGSQQPLLTTAGVGTITISGSGPYTATFSNSTDCSNINVGSTILTGITAQAIVISKSCPTAVVQTTALTTTDSFIWSNVVDSDGGFWMDSYLMYGLGRTQEVFGSAGEPIKAYYSKVFTDALTSGSFNAWLIASYRQPVITALIQPVSWVPTMAAKLALYATAFQGVTSWATLDTLMGGYGYAYYYAESAVGAVSYTAGEVNGAAAWSFMNTNELATDTAFATDPRWAILPRGGSGPTASVTVSGATCRSGCSIH